ncbi:uncharacterized protein EI90DRAFT_1735743 [Cantharellus anzutake]|uniref:uncharacterized protein n=1 Tax=Cantharellus anzutake TaxID=1750568 RepID=UPI001905F2BB|nr:uncharacterized protein EI90DRAFT_1735743 [Cantharellus anzutake]KAF8341416.1 hypothetical protein EI90DRAFT_1735743 [Cantharellus anzutake]
MPNPSTSSAHSILSRRINNVTGPLITDGPVPPRLRNSPFLFQMTTSTSTASIPSSYHSTSPHSSLPPPIPILAADGSTHPTSAWLDHAEYSAPPSSTSSTSSTSPPSPQSLSFSVPGTLLPPRTKTTSVRAKLRSLSSSSSQPQPHHHHSSASQSANANSHLYYSSSPCERAALAGSGRIIPSIQVSLGGQPSYATTTFGESEDEEEDGEKRVGMGEVLSMTRR